MKAVQVRLFAGLRERAGTDMIEVSLGSDATVGDLLEAVGDQLDLDTNTVVVAVDRQYADRSAPLAGAREVALVPPVSGGAASHPTVHFALQQGRLEVDQLLERVTVAGPVGAVVLFQGVTREVTALEYEVYGEMAEATMPRLLEEVADRYGLTAVAVEHRIGSVPLGESGIVLATSAGHRAEAFGAAEELMDRIKQEMPIWKKEVDRSGSGEWVEGRTAASSPDRPTHIDAAGRAAMVDVAGKDVTRRIAVAEATVRMKPETARAVAQADLPKGDLVGPARLAGVQAAKRTWELIPLAHQIALAFCDVEIAIEPDQGLVRIVGTAGASDRTGVEMEALTACSVAALTVYDMTKGIERGIEIEGIRLIEKSGGRSGHWKR